MFVRQSGCRIERHDIREREKGEDERTHGKTQDTTRLHNKGEPENRSPSTTIRRQLRHLRHHYLIVVVTQKLRLRSGTLRQHNLSAPRITQRKKKVTRSLWVMSYHYEMNVLWKSHQASSAGCMGYLKVDLGDVPDHNMQRGRLQLRPHSPMLI